MTSRRSAIGIFLTYVCVGGILAGRLTSNELPEDQSNTTSNTSNGTREATVLILGGGVAGITAAQTLTDRGINDFIILEGSDRIGGRIKSVKFGGKTIEVGANWILFKNDTNPLWKAMQKYNISGLDFDDDDAIIRDENGTDITKLGEESWERLEKAESKMEELFTRLKKDKTDMSLRTCLDIAGWQANTPVDKIVEIFQYDFEFGNIPGVDSCKSYDFLRAYLAEDYYVSDVDGLESVVHKMANAFLKSNDTRLIMNEVVHTINYTSNGVSVQTNSGNVYKADYALLTFSLAVIKNGHISFNPPLPNWKIDNLFRVRMEDYVKIFLKFPSGAGQFWDDNNYIMHASTRRGYFPVFINHNAESLPAKGTNILQIVSLAEEATRLSAMQESDIITEVMAMLKRVYPNHIIVNPEDVYITRWTTDPLYLTTFANIEPGIKQEQFEAIKAPVDRLYFAGDAYSRGFDGYATGAALTGEDNANKMAACIKGDKCYKYNPNPQTDSPSITTCGCEGPHNTIVLFFVIMTTIIFM